MSVASMSIIRHMALRGKAASSATSCKNTHTSPGTPTHIHSNTTYGLSPDYLRIIATTWINTAADTWSSSRTKKSSPDRKEPRHSGERRSPSPHTSQHQEGPKSPQMERPTCRRDDSREESRDRYSCGRTPSPHRSDKYSSRRYQPSTDWRQRHRGRSHSPHRMNKRYQHHPRAYDENELEWAIYNILARRGLRQNKTKGLPSKKRVSFENKTICLYDQILPARLQPPPTQSSLSTCL